MLSLSWVAELLVLLAGCFLSGLFDICPCVWVPHVMETEDSKKKGWEGEKYGINMESRYLKETETTKH